MAKKINWVSGYGFVLIIVAFLLFYNRSTVQNYFTSKKEGFVSKKCPDGTRSDGPCLMEF